jgi:predicted peptidase
MAEADDQVPRGLATMMVVGLLLLAGGGAVYMWVLGHNSSEPLHLEARRADDAGRHAVAPPIQKQLDIDALVQQKREVREAYPDRAGAPPQAAAADTGLTVVSAEQCAAREKAIAPMLENLALLNAERFEARTYTDAGGKTMPYRLFKPPGYDAPGNTRKYPLVMVLHAAGGRGADNLKNLDGPSVLAAGVWAMRETQQKHSCLVLVPQCPEGQSWEEGSSPDTVTEAARLAGETLDRICAEFRVDQSRVYVTGVAEGGFGALGMLARWPKRFAAAVAVSAAPTEEQAKLIAGAKAHVWTLHGAREAEVRTEGLRRLIKQLKAAGASARETEYEGAAEAWKYAYAEPGLAEWLFEQRRAEQ